MSYRNRKSDIEASPMFSSMSSTEKCWLSALQSVMISSSVLYWAQDWTWIGLGGVIAPVYPIPLSPLSSLTTPLSSVHQMLGPRPNLNNSRTHLTNPFPKF